MYTTGMVVMVFLAVAVVMASAWPYDDDYWRLVSRRSFGYCEGSGGKCFSTAQCCKGFVCAAFDDVLEGEAKNPQGENPEIPGFCVKEKDLQRCFRSQECDSRSQCITLGSAGDKYCVRDPRAQEEQAFPSPGRGHGKQSPPGRKGAPCERDSDCKAFSENNQKMCCQRQRRGRQTTKQICNVITPISECIENQD